MTAAATGRAARRAPAFEPRPSPDWVMVGVVAGILAQFATIVWIASAGLQRISAIEAQVPPGAIQRLDERTLQIQAALGRLEAKP